MKELLFNLFKTVSTFLFALLAPLILVIVGALGVGYGEYKEWQWMTTGGVFLAALGLMFIFRYWWFDD